MRRNTSVNTAKPWRVVLATTSKNEAKRKISFIRSKFGKAMETFCSGSFFNGIVKLNLTSCGLSLDYGVNRLIIEEFVIWQEKKQEEKNQVVLSF